MRFIVVFDGSNFAHVILPFVNDVVRGIDHFRLVVVRWNKKLTGRRHLMFVLIAR